MIATGGTVDLAEWIIWKYFSFLASGQILKLLEKGQSSKFTGSRKVEKITLRVQQGQFFLRIFSPVKYGNYGGEVHFSAVCSL